MTGRIPPFGRLASALACWLILAACLAVCGCGARSAQRAQGGRLSPEAKQTYDYLVYQDMILRLQRLVRKENPSKQDMDEAYALQKKAAEALDKIIGSEPEPKLYAEKAGLYWNTEQIAEARQALKQGLERFPKDKTLNLYLANSYLVENRLQDAALTLGDYLGRAPDDHLARERLAQILLDTGQDARALDELKLIPGPERSAETLYLMARAQARLGQRRQAIETLKRSLEKDGDLIEAWAELAYQYELEKDYVSAEKTYNKILSLGELQDEVMIRLINLGLKMNNPEKALAVALNGPGTKAFVLDAAAVFLSEGFPAQASTVLDVLSAAKPVPSEYYFYKAVIAYEGENDPEKALAFLDKVPEEDRTRSQAIQFRAQIYLAMGRDSQALELMARGRRLYPGQNRFFLLEAAYWVDKKEYPAAKRIVDQGLELMPNDSELLFELGVVLEGQGDRTGGLAVMEKVIAKDPDHADALNYVGYTLADEGRDLDRALVLIETAVGQSPDNGYIIDSLAWVYFRLKRFGEAWTEIQRAVAIVGDDPIIWEHYGDIARAAGDRNKALKGYRNALKHQTEDPKRVRGKMDSL